ncbi:MAG: TetR/AcrR family transcriptional regulator [Novosphingobium sp.]
MPNARLAEMIGEFATDRKGRKLSKNRLLRRAQIMQATLDLIAARGYDTVTMDELAAASQVTKKTLYDIYGSKQAVVAQAVALRLDGLAESLEQDLSGDGLARLLAMVDKTCDAVLETPELSRALATRLVRSADEFHLTRFFDRLHRAAIEQMKTERQIQPWANVDFTVRSMMFDQIAVQSMWAGGNVGDDQYPGFARLSALRIITPLARASLRKHIVEQIRTMQQELTFAPSLYPAAQY